MTEKAVDWARLDQQYVWHPFTPMQQWRETPPLVIERGEGPFLFDADGRQYVDGVSSLWCNVHGHCVPAIDRAVKDQLEKIAHTTLLGLASPPSIQLAQRLCEAAPKSAEGSGKSLSKVFYSDAGATALEVAFKMAVGYWFHAGKPEKKKFIGLAGAYHGDTTGSMSIGYSDLFHLPFKSMLFETSWFPAPSPLPGRFDVTEVSRQKDLWPSEDEAYHQAVGEICIGQLETMLQKDAENTAAIVIEPVMQGAAGMVLQPLGFVKRVAELADAYGVLLIADEVATGFGRTGSLFACEGEEVVPDILCLAKGITGGYLPLAATLTTDEIEQAFCGELAERKTLYHGHTYTGNPLAAAAAIAALDLFDVPPPGSDAKDLLGHVQISIEIIRQELLPLKDCLQVQDIRHRGLMVGIELCEKRVTDGPPKPFDFAARTGHKICHRLRDQGVLIRPLGDVLILMPILSTPHEVLKDMVQKVVRAILDHH